MAGADEADKSRVQLPRDPAWGPGRRPLTPPLPQPGLSWPSLPPPFPSQWGGRQTRPTDLEANLRSPGKVPPPSPPPRPPLCSSPPLTPPRPPARPTPRSAPPPPRPPPPPDPPPPAPHPTLCSSPPPAPRSAPPLRQVQHSCASSPPPRVLVLRSTSLLNSLILLKSILNTLGSLKPFS